MMPLRARTAAVAAFALLVAAVPAWGAPAISGTDGDVWNASSPPVTYTITGSAPGAPLAWALTGGRGRDRIEPVAGPSPLTVTLPDLRDGDEYRLVAVEVGDRRPPLAAQRGFAVDRTAPTVEIDSPAQGAVLGLGQQVKADFECRGERSCTAPVRDGDPLPTGVAGPQAFVVTAVDAAGNVTTLQRDYTVAAAGIVPAPSLTPATPTAPPATGGGPPKTGPSTIALPPPEHASRLRPRVGARLHSLRPVLRWKPRRGAALYNVQVFRLRGTRLVKVLSVFPRTNSVRVPAKRLKRGARHVWRVWPMVGKRFTPKPLGISNFEVRRSAER